LIFRGSKFSFSLYLIHFPIIALVTSQLTPINRWTMSAMGLLVLLGITLVVLLIAHAFARLTEFNLDRLRTELRLFLQKL
jgi:peptidoglycan/LPS O-acetylase OafA/YrhL